MDTVHYIENIDRPKIIRFSYVASNCY